MSSLCLLYGLKNLSSQHNIPQHPNPPQEQQVSHFKLLSDGNLKSSSAYAVRNVKLATAVSLVDCLYTVPAAKVTLKCPLIIINERILPD